MTEEELLTRFEARVNRYLSALDKSSLEGNFKPAMDDYFNCARDLGANLLLEMVKAYRVRGATLAELSDLRAEVLRIGEQIEAATTADSPHLRVRALPQLDFGAAELDTLWRRYAREDPEKLTPKARMLAERLRSVFEEIETAGGAQ
jgi:hypothetical protein